MAHAAGELRAAQLTTTSTSLRVSKQSCRPCPDAMLICRALIAGCCPLFSGFMNSGTGTDVHNPAVAEVRQPVEKLVGHVTAKVILVNSEVEKGAAELQSAPRRLAHRLQNLQGADGLPQSRSAGPQCKGTQRPADFDRPGGEVEWCVKPTCRCSQPLQHAHFGKAQLLSMAGPTLHDFKRCCTTNWPR